MKTCLEPGCPRLTTATRCPAHTRVRDRQRGTTTARGYGAAHQQAKARAEAITSPTDPCPKCGQPLGPPPWDLGHTPDRTGYEGPTHPACNRATAGRLDGKGDS